MIGSQTGTQSTIAHVCASGKIEVANASTNNVYVGGIVGKLSATGTVLDSANYDVLTASYANVSIINKVVTNRANVCAGAIAGYAMATDKKTFG